MLPMRTLKAGAAWLVRSTAVAMTVACLACGTASKETCGGSGESCCNGTACNNGLTCSGGTCSDAGQGSGTPGGTPCNTQSDCPAPLACASDYSCTNLCSTNADCNVLGVTAKVCTKDDSGVNYCANPTAGVGTSTDASTDG